MEQARTHLGTNELHRRHSVMIEGGKVPRARVMDQTVMDRLLMEGRLTIAQHQAGELLLQQALWAGMWPKAGRWDGAGGGTPGCVVPLGVTAFGDSLAAIRRELGSAHEKLVKRVVVDNCSIVSDMSNVDKLREALDFIADSRCGRSCDPVRRLRKVG